MNHASIAEMEAAIARDEATNPAAYYEYEGTIDESHQRAKLTAPEHCARCWADPATDFDHADFDTYRTAFLAPDGKWTTVPARASSDDVDDIPVSRIPAAAHRGPREPDTTCPECWGTGCIACQWTGSTDVSQREDLTLPTGGPTVNYGASGI